MNKNESALASISLEDLREEVLSRTKARIQELKEELASLESDSANPVFDNKDHGNVQDIIWNILRREQRSMTARQIKAKMDEAPLTDRRFKYEIGTIRTTLHNFTYGNNSAHGRKYFENVAWGVYAHLLVPQTKIVRDR